MQDRLFPVIAVYSDPNIISDDEFISLEVIAERLRQSENKGMLGATITEEILKFSIFELQVIGGRLNREIDALPPHYRNKIRSYFRDQIFGAYHLLLSQYRSGVFSSMKTGIKDLEVFGLFCAMIPHGCSAWDEELWKNPGIWSPKNRLFYYLVSAFTMFVLDKPGHPVGMPFPGGQLVEKRGTEYYCPIRDKEKDIFFSICNFCPAKQS